MQKLIQGVHDFQSNAYGTHRELFEKLGKGQQPETLFITCSDSRIDPCLLTQTKPGELFVIRNAGNIVPTYGSGNSGEAATIEYAIKALGVRDVIVCGHSQCGAVKGLLTLDQLDALPTVKTWLENAHATLEVVQTKHAAATGDQLVSEAIKENVLVQLGNLRTHPSVAAAVAAGKINLHGWVYHFETGDVHAFDAETGDFTSIRQNASA